LLTAVPAGRASQVFSEHFVTNPRFYRLFLWEWHMWRWDVTATGDVEGHLGPYGVTDPAGYGRAARVRDCAAYRTNQSRRYLVESRDDICVLGALATARADSEWGTSENNRRAKFYKITPRGSQRLAETAANWEQLSTVIAAFFAQKGDRKP
jgi:hypothetical protein